VTGNPASRTPLHDDHTILWKRIDVPGHDACHLGWTGDGWMLDGVAAFLEEGEPASLRYRILCDATWRSRKGRVTGWLGARRIHLRVRRTRSGGWTLNDQIVPGLGDCVDLDLGFTPATNLTQLRRIALAIGRSADVPVAWLDVAAGTLDLLHQRYTRRTESAYWYEAPRFEYAELLEFGPEGFARRYPRLWEAEP